MLTILSGYGFGAAHMYGVSAANQTSPQTLVSLMFLTFVVVARRAEYGAFSTLIGIGIGGTIARLTTPFALALPFGITAAAGLLVRSGRLTLPYAASIVTSLAAMIALGCVMALARRIDEQEKEIRDLSLRDSLTGLYNRRGFYVLAEQALRMAQRTKAPFSVLFIDLDNLKQVNDALGHEAGSAFLSEVADLLQLTFRRSDILGRIGGDEFVVACEAEEAEMAAAAQRLEDEASRISAQGHREYPMSFSLGRITSRTDGQESLETLLSSADKAMYLAKQRRKRDLIEQE